MTSTDQDLRRARRRFIAVGIALPLFATAVGVVLMLVWMPELPATVATHWNAAGDANGFGPVWIAPLLTAIVGIVFALLIGLSVLAGAREGEWGPTMRFLGALNAGITVYLVVLVTWSLAMQRGLADPSGAPSIVPALSAGAVVGIVVGVAAWFAQPSVIISGGRAGATSEADRIVLGPGERAVWLRSTALARGGLIAIVVGTLACAVVALWLALTTGPWWAFLLIAAVLALVLLATSVFRVRVDDVGLTVIAPLGVPRFRVPLSDIQTVALTRVSPLAEFGGWGIRLGLDGRFGVVLHRGEAIQVTRTHGRVFVVTVDDAETGAALLEALVERERAQR